MHVVRVRSLRRATPSTRIVRLDTPSEFDYRAGQWARLGPLASPVLAPYSVASAPEDAVRERSLEFLIKVDAAGEWGEDFPPLARGQRLHLRGPFGAFTFPERPEERRFLFIAGGTGIAPLRAMLRHARIACPGGTYSMFYSARTPGDFAFLAELRGMARRGELRLVLTTTRDGNERWRGERGRITAARIAPLVESPATLCFVCGPSAMVEAVPPILASLGIERRRIRVEEQDESQK